jgi:hypothetical protein
MPNPRLVDTDYVKTASFTLRAKDLKYLDKIAKKFKNRSEALRVILDEAQKLNWGTGEGPRILGFKNPTGGNCPRKSK